MPGKDIVEKVTEDMEVEVADEVEDHLCHCAEELERENAQLAQQLLRLKADFENFRRRSKGQMESLVLEANEQLLLDLLPVLDNFERALSSHSEGDQDPFWQGVQMVQQGLLTTLANHGLQAIVAEGQPFDPYFHEAISMEGEGGDSLVVVQQIQTGYLLNGKVIRHTKVLVGQNKEEDECQK